MAAGLNASAEEVPMAAMIRALLLSAVLILLSFVAFGFWSGTAWERYPRFSGPRPVGTSGVLNRTRETFDDTTITSKIKAKMMLDDRVEARTIGVTTHDGVVTLTGTVDSV